MYEALVARVRYHIQKANFMGPKDAESTLLLNEAADAIEELQKQVEDYECRLEISPEAEYTIDKHCDDIISRMDKLIKGLDDKPRWIPVTERLPEVFKHVLVNIPGMSPHPTVQEAFLEKNGMWYSNGFRYGADEITHWTPIPKPPKEGEA